ncbi:uncharacterized protein Z519_11502 [Cladophialophora bantiana CBS 173.52]|uniref:Uncharacterized protein n=1 Tax=Cladophialophora bantiana (strain ATCC 10958 / CBS 173.52 / CDC B-1940 / NIH 8579) TaxID=1442370 RepID=A0A0D2FMI7_CLAB1|nr:uncharacterized protein Z519_11502 [Cladophialophora bantiana CBS 173.52]KIW87917.1 hypothetical protein Z519_11502 [Cladophialophora bantiana CBS 173.52]
MEIENRGDIRLYVHHELQRYINDPKAIEELRETIVSRDSGIFQWAVLMVGTVHDLYLSGVRLSRILDAISTKPVHPHDLYRSLFEDIGKEKRQKSLQIIRWVLFAKQPLSLGQLRHAIAVESDPESTSLAECLESVDCETDDELERRIRELSRGLLEGYGVYRMIQFIHQSALDFVSEEGYRILDDSLQSFEEFIGKSHFKLSRICVRYMNMERAQLDRSLKYDDLADFIQDTGLLGYASNYWLRHAKDVEAHNIHQDDLLALFGWLVSELVDAWTRSQIHFRLQNPIPVKVEVGMDLLEIAARSGLTSVVRECLDRLSKNVVKVPADHWEHHRSPLSWAAASAEEGVVKMLIERDDVDVNFKGAGKHPPILYAASRGHVQIVKLLLTHKAIDVNRTSKGRTLLGYALVCGFDEIQSLLLSRNDLDVNLLYRGKSLLAWAIRKNDKQFLKKLLERKDINVNLQDVKGWTSTPLCWAAYYGHVEIIKMLLAHPAIDVDMKDAWGGNALEIATGKRRQDIIALLKDARATMPEPPASRTVYYGAEGDL